VNVLHLESNPDDVDLVRALLRAEWPGCHLTVVTHRPEFLLELGRDGFDLIISDFSLEGLAGLDALALACAQRPDLPFIFFTDSSGEDRALDAVHHGAADYVLKDHVQRLPTAVKRALRDSNERRQRRQIEAANQRLLDIFANTPDLVALTSPAGQVLHLNRAGYRLLGLADGTDLATLTLRDFHPPDIADFILCQALPEAIRDNTWTGETVLLSRDGTRVPVSQVLIAHRNTDGFVGHLSMIMRDLTGQRRHESAVRESNERFQLVARATDDSIWDLNLLTGDLWWSEAYETRYGYPRTAEESTIAAWRSHLHPDDGPRVEASLRHAISHGPPIWSEEYRFRRADGTYAEVLDRGQILQDSEGRPARMIGSMLDITERKQAERRVRDLIGLLDKAPDAIFLTDLDGRVTFWNHGAERLTGRPGATAIGQRVEALFGPEITAKLAQIHADLATKGEWRGELHLRTPHPLIVDYNATVVRDDCGQPKARLTIATDITERKQLEDRFLRTQRLESVGMLAAGIAHDLNNVLSPILMGAPMLRAHLSDPSDLQLVAMFEKSAERGAGLVRQILNFAQGVGGELRPIQVRHILRDLAAVVRETFPKNIRYEERVPRDLWLVAANPTQIHQVLLNLCVNARDALPDGGKLSLRAENLVLDATTARAIPGARPGSWLVLHVEDTGTGIAPEILARVWEPFYTTKESGKGTGLGLSTVRGIVETHHGFITVQSELGAGTAFHIFLPAVEGATGETAAPAGRATPRGAGELILVVDDEPNIRDVTASTLTRHGYLVIAARDGSEALTLFSRTNRDVRLVITDLHMPRLDGAGIARVIRCLNPTVRIIAASGLDSGSRPGDPVPAFADAFLAKPFHPDTLLNTVHRLLHTPVNPAPLPEPALVSSSVDFVQK
jgi:two-component system cell cycle sensor histidine kinase/response regulator CckA